MCLNRDTLQEPLCFLVLCETHFYIFVKRAFEKEGFWDVRKKQITKTNVTN